MRLYKACILLVISSLAISVLAAESNRERLSVQGRRKLDTIIEIVRKKHLKTLSENELIDSAVNGVLARLDSHSYFYDPAAFKEISTYTSGEFSGIGVAIQVEKGQALVMSVIANSPAAVAGIRPGDWIVAINGASVSSMQQHQVLRALSGLPNTEITVTVLRQDKSLKFVLRRRMVDLNSVEYELLPRGIVYLKIGAFYENTAEAIDKAMTRIKALSENKKITGLILDLRDNSGGMLEQAVSVASIFINKGTVVQVSSPILGERVHYECLQDVPFKLDSKVPVVVLINRGTASAAEVVAGALRDHKRAIIMGKKSFGKGSVQEFIQMDDGSALSITTALYYTPSGRSIEKVGLIPDIVVVKGREPTKQGNTFRGMRDIIKAANGIMNKEMR